MRLIVYVLYVQQAVREEKRKVDEGNRSHASPIGATSASTLSMGVLGLAIIAAWCAGWQARAEADRGQ